jgi:hypothetical protein
MNAGIANTNSLQLVPSTFSSKATSPSIILEWVRLKIFLVSCGKNMRFLIHDTLLPMPSSCAWRLSQLCVLSPIPDLPTILTSLPIVHLGPHVLHRCILHHNLASSATSSANHCLRGADIRIDSLLCHKHVRSLLHENHILAARGAVFLGILLFHELHLDGFSRQYVYPQSIYLFISSRQRRTRRVHCSDL